MSGNWIATESLAAMLGLSLPQMLRRTSVMAGSALSMGSLRRHLDKRRTSPECRSLGEMVRNKMSP